MCGVDIIRYVVNVSLNWEVPRPNASYGPVRSNGYAVVGMSNVY